MPSRVTPLNRSQLIELDVLVQSLTNSVINKSYEHNYITQSNVNSCSSPTTTKAAAAAVGANRREHFATYGTSHEFHLFNTNIGGDKSEQNLYNGSKSTDLLFIPSKSLQVTENEEETHNCEEKEEHDQTESHPILDGRYVDVFNDPIVNGKENILQRWKWHEKMLYFVWWSFLPSRCEECGMSGSWNVSPETEARCGQCGWAVGSTASRKVVEDVKRRREHGGVFNAGGQAESSDDDDDDNDNEENDDDEEEDGDDDDDDQYGGDDNDNIENDGEDNIHDEESDIVIEQDSMDDNFMDHNHVDVPFSNTNVALTVNNITNNSNSTSSSQHEHKLNALNGNNYTKNVKKSNVHKFVLGSTLINKSLNANGKAGLYNYADAKKNVFAAFTFYCDWLQRTEIIMHAHNIQTVQEKNQKEQYEENESIALQQVQEEQEKYSEENNEQVRRQANRSKVKAQNIHKNEKRNAECSSLANFPNGEELARVIREAYEMSQLLIMPGLTFAHTAGRSGLDKNNLLIRAGCLYLTLTLHRYHIPFPLFASASDNAWISAILRKRVAEPVKGASNRLRLQWNDVELLASLLGIPIGNFFESAHVVEQYMTNLFILVASSRCALPSPVKGIRGRNANLYSSVPSILWHPHRVKKRCEYIMSFSHVEKVNTNSHASKKSSDKATCKGIGNDLCPEFIAVAMSLELARQVDEHPLIQVSGSMGEAASHSTRIGAWLDELSLYPTRQVYRSMEEFTKQAQSNKLEQELAKGYDSNLRDKEATELFYKMLTTRAATSDPCFAQDEQTVNVFHDNCGVNDKESNRCNNASDVNEKVKDIDSFISVDNNNCCTNDVDQKANVSSVNGAAAIGANCIDNKPASEKALYYTTENSPFFGDFALIFPSPCANSLLHIFARTFRLTAMELADKVIQSGIYTGNHFFVERLQEYMCQGLYSVLPLYRRLSPITSFWLSVYMALYSEHRTILLSILHRLYKPVQYNTAQISRNEMNSLIKLLQTILRSHESQLRVQLNYVIRVSDEREQHFNGIYYCSSYLGQSGLVTFTCIRSGRKTLTFNRYNKQISLCYLSSKEKLVNSLRYTCGTPVVIEVESPVTKQILDTMFSSNSANLSLIKLNTNQFTRSANAGNINSNSTKYNNNNTANNFNGDLPNHAMEWKNVVRAIGQLAHIRRRMRVPMLAARLNALQSLHTLRSERNRENRLVYEHTELVSNSYGYGYGYGLPDTRYAHSLPTSHFGKEVGFASGQRSWLNSAHEIDPQNLLNSSSLSLTSPSSLSSNSDHLFDLLSLQNYVCLNFLSLPHHSLLFGMSEERIVALYTSVLTLLEIINRCHHNLHHRNNDLNEQEERARQKTACAEHKLQYKSEYYLHENERLEQEITKKCTLQYKKGMMEEYDEQQNGNGKSLKAEVEIYRVSEGNVVNNDDNWLHDNCSNFKASNKRDAKNNLSDKANTSVDQEELNKMTWIDELIRIYDSVMCQNEKKYVNAAINNNSRSDDNNNRYAENVQMEEEKYGNVNSLSTNRVETPCYAPISSYSHGGSGVVTPIHAYSDVDKNETATHKAERVRGTEFDPKCHVQETHCVNSKSSNSNSISRKGSIVAKSYMSNRELTYTATPPLLPLTQMTPVLQAKNVGQQRQKHEQSKIRIMQEQHHKEYNQVKSENDMKSRKCKFAKKEESSLSDESDAERKSESEDDLDAFQLTTSTADAWHENRLSGHKKDGNINDEHTTKKARARKDGRCTSVSSAESVEESASDQLHSYHDLNKECNVNNAQIMNTTNNHAEQKEHQNSSHKNNNNTNNYNSVNMKISMTCKTIKLIECLKLVQLCLRSNLPSYNDVLLGKAKVNMQILSSCNYETLHSTPAYVTLKSKMSKKSSSRNSMVKQEENLVIQEISNEYYDNNMEASFANYNLFTAEECRQQLVKLHEFVKNYLLVKRTLWHAVMTDKIAKKNEEHAEIVNKQEEDEFNSPNEDKTNHKLYNSNKCKEEEFDDNDNAELEDVNVKQSLELNIDSDNNSKERFMKREREEVVKADVGISVEENEENGMCTSSNAVDVTRTPVLRNKRHKTGRQRRRGERRQERILEKYNKT